MKKLSVIMAAILAAGAFEYGIAKSENTVNKSLCISKGSFAVTDTVPGKKRRNPNRPTHPRDTVSRPSHPRDTVNPTRPTNPTTPTNPTPPTNPTSPTRPATPTTPTNPTPTPKPPVK